MEEDFIPTFEIDTTTDEYAILKQIDEFEDNIRILDDLKNQYEDIKSNIKKKMIDFGKKNKSTQVKWITPKGIQITCSIGQKPIFEKVTENRFDIDILKKDYPEIYEKCCKEVTYEECVKFRTNDVLRITLPKN